MKKRISNQMQIETILETGAEPLFWNGDAAIFDLNDAKVKEGLLNYQIRFCFRNKGTR